MSACNTERAFDCLSFHFPQPRLNSNQNDKMEEIGIELKLEVTSPYHPQHQLSFVHQDSTIPSQATEKQALLNSLPSGDEELYSTWKRLEAHKEFLELQEVNALILHSCSSFRYRVIADDSC